MKNYKIILDILGKKYINSGKTMEDALAGFKLCSADIKGKGTVAVNCGSKKLEPKWFNAVVIRRIFANPIVRSYWARNLEMLMR